MRLRARGAVAAAAAGLFIVALPGVAEAVPERYERYYAWFDPGPNPYALADTRWVPQGMTNFGTDRLVISYYDSTGRDNSLIVITDLNGVQRKVLRFDHSGHVGGLAATSKYLWVTYGEGVRRYSRSAIDSASNGATIRHSYFKDTLSQPSYLYAEGENVWLGNFDWDTDPIGFTNCPEYNEDREKMYRYRVDTAGNLVYGNATVAAPGATQGVVVTSTKFIWSTSCGRDSDSRLVVWDRTKAYDGTNDYGNIYTAPNMSEGITRVGSKLYVIFEAGSAHYADADYRVTNIHRGAIPEAYGDGWP